MFGLQKLTKSKSENIRSVHVWPVRDGVYPAVAGAGYRPLLHMVHSHGCPVWTELYDTLIRPASPIRSHPLPPLGLIRHGSITWSPAACPDRLRVLCLQ